VVARERADGALRDIKRRRAEAAALEQRQREATEAQRVAKSLGQLLRADGFQRWLLGAALDVLVTDASRTLADLSAGQFELGHDGTDFLVIDHFDADSRRPVKTLSGGETFQASLALALALSSQLAGMAAAGAARLDSIFLDEGFGTLDEATLDVVAATLENLAAGGDRMVGVVTHVPGLAERVPVRFEVRRDQRTSSLSREGM
jgi:exonuclease SbcC